MWLLLARQLEELSPACLEVRWSRQCILQGILDKVMGSGEVTVVMRMFSVDRTAWLYSLQITMTSISSSM